MTELSIVVVSHNSRELLMRCLQSVLRAAEALALEVLVIDNDSQDGSADAIQSQFPQVQLIRNSSNRGFARGCNQGLRRARGRHLLLLSPATEIDPGALAAMTSFMESTPAAGAVGAQLMHEDGRPQVSVANFPDLWIEMTKGSLWQRLFPERTPPQETPFSGPAEVDSLIGACIMTRREVLQDVGYLDEGYFFQLAETDWCLRMRNKGWPIFFLPHVRIIHHQGESRVQNRATYRIDYYRSRYRYFAQHHSRRDCTLLRVGLFVKLCVQCTASFVMALGTLFLNRKEVARLKARWRLLAWHLTGCPEPQTDPAG
jgi:GT2 family glycosyltransferase